MAEGLPPTLAYWPHAQTVEKEPIAMCPCGSLKQNQLDITVWFLTSLAFFFFFLDTTLTFFTYQTVHSVVCWQVIIKEIPIHQSEAWGSSHEGRPLSTTHKLFSLRHTSEPFSCCDMGTCRRSHFIILDSEFLVFTSAHCSFQSLLGEGSNTDSHSDSGWPTSENKGWSKSYLISTPLGSLSSFKNCK